MTFALDLLSEATLMDNDSVLLVWGVPAKHFFISQYGKLKNGDCVELDKEAGELYVYFLNHPEYISWRASEDVRKDNLNLIPKICLLHNIKLAGVP